MIPPNLSLNSTPKKSLKTRKISKEEKKEKRRKEKEEKELKEKEERERKEKEEKEKKPPPKPVNPRFAFLAKNREICVNCQKTVYAAEKVLGPKNKIYHKLCLRCLSCNKGVSMGSFVDHDEEPFCKGCYAKYFGPKGLGFGTLSFAQ